MSFCPVCQYETTSGLETQTPIPQPSWFGTKLLFWLPQTNIPECTQCFISHQLFQALLSFQVLIYASYKWEYPPLPLCAKPFLFLFSLHSPQTRTLALSLPEYLEFELILFSPNNLLVPLLHCFYHSIMFYSQGQTSVQVTPMTHFALRLIILLWGTDTFYLQYIWWSSLTD